MNDPHVLVVEPSPAFRTILLHALWRQCRLRSIGAATGVAALGALRQHRPKVVILARDLPDGDAFTLATAVRSLATPPPALVLVVHQPSRDDQRRAARSRFATVIVRPATEKQSPELVDAVVAAVRTQLSR